MNLNNILGLGNLNNWIKFKNNKMNDAFLFALNHFGEKEISGDIDNPEILKYYHELGHKWVEHDEVAWCAAFVGYSLLKKGYIIPPLKERLRARAYQFIGTETENPVVGRDLVVFWRGNSIDSGLGHVAWFIRGKGELIYVYGGNQSNESNISPYSKDEKIAYITPIKINKWQ